MPTIKDRVQVLLDPDTYADLQLIRKEERRSAGAMGAVLIAEAIAARKLNGSFVPDEAESDEALEVAKLRRLAKQTGKGVNDLVENKKEEKEEAEVSKEALIKALKDLLGS